MIAADLALFYNRTTLDSIVASCMQYDFLYFTLQYVSYAFYYFEKRLMF